MLELPEVITLSKQVNNALSGKTITQVFNATKPHKFTFYNGDPSEYGKLLVGKTILSSEGYGMFVNFNLSDNVIMSRYCWYQHCWPWGRAEPAAWPC